MGSATQRGFTLVEVLVVTALLAVLAALLFPTFALARARARQAQCGSNLAQIGKANQLYVEDYDGRFPSCYWSAQPPFAIDHLTTLQPYLKNRDMLYCPERQTRLAECLDPRDEFRPGSRCMGYGYNWGSGIGWGRAFSKGDGLVRPAAGGAVFGVTLPEVVEPSRCLAFGDTNDSAFLTLLREAMPGVRQGGREDASTNGLGRPYEPPRHGAGNNFVFVDGHAEWLRMPGGLWEDGGPRVVPEMRLYSRTGRWEAGPVP